MVGWEGEWIKERTPLKSGQVMGNSLVQNREKGPKHASVLIVEAATEHVVCLFMLKLECSSLQLHQ